MSKTSPAKNAQEQPVPFIPVTWDLQVHNYGPPLATLNRIQIDHQRAGVSVNPIFGRVRTGPLDETTYGIDGGQVAFQEGTDSLILSFHLSINGTVYTFTGKIEEGPNGPQVQNGIVTPPPPPQPITEEGVWSAQAQGGGGPGESEVRRPSHKRDTSQ